MGGRARPISGAKAPALWAELITSLSQKMGRRLTDSEMRPHSYRARASTVDKKRRRATNRRLKYANTGPNLGDDGVESRGRRGFWAMEVRKWGGTHGGTSNLRTPDRLNSYHDSFRASQICAHEASGVATRAIRFLGRPDSDCATPSPPGGGALSSKTSISASCFTRIAKSAWPGVPITRFLTKTLETYDTISAMARPSFTQ